MIHDQITADARTVAHLADCFQELKQAALELKQNVPAGQRGCGTFWCRIRRPVPLCRSWSLRFATIPSSRRRYGRQLFWWRMQRRYCSLMRHASCAKRLATTPWSGTSSTSPSPAWHPGGHIRHGATVAHQPRYQRGTYAGTGARGEAARFRLRLHALGSARVHGGRVPVVRGHGRDPFVCSPMSLRRHNLSV